MKRSNCSRQGASSLMRVTGVVSRASWSATISSRSLLCRHEVVLTVTLTCSQRGVVVCITMVNIVRSKFALCPSFGGCKACAYRSCSVDSVDCLLRSLHSRSYSSKPSEMHTHGDRRGARRIRAQRSSIGRRLAFAYPARNAVELSGPHISTLWQEALCAPSGPATLQSCGETLSL